MTKLRSSREARLRGPHAFGRHCLALALVLVDCGGAAVRDRETAVPALATAPAVEPPRPAAQAKSKEPEIEESFAGREAVLDTERLQRLDAFVEDARTIAGVPGVAIAVVHRGQVVLEKGYGVRSLVGRAPVEPTTLFEIGSVTKGMTTLALAQLADRGKLTWDTPITDILPEFTLADREAAAKMKVRHTACACTGMPRGDFAMLFEYAHTTPRSQLADLATMRPTSTFGSYSYSNVMVCLAGWLAGRAYAPRLELGRAYDRAMRELVFGPLGMRSTTLDFSVVAKREHADGHSRGFSMEFQPIANDPRWLKAVRPAGGVWSSARDMARYLLVELGEGELDGKRIVSAKHLLARREPQVEVDDGAHYGLGLGVLDMWGVATVQHDGGTLGQTSFWLIVPEHELGIVVLTNAAAALEFIDAVRRGLFEIVFSGRTRARADLERQMATMAEEARTESERLAKVDVKWIEPLVGRYRDPELGAIEVARRGDTFVLDAGEWSSEIAKYSDDDGSAAIVTLDPPYTGYVLTPSPAGALELDTGDRLYVFARQPK